MDQLSAIAKILTGDVPGPLWKKVLCMLMGLSLCLLMGWLVSGCAMVKDSLQPTAEPDCYKVAPSALSWGGYDCSRKADGSGKF